MTVHVVNRNTYTGRDAHYVGRPSPLSNPFTVKQHGPDNAIELYKDWLNIQYRTNNRVVTNELIRLAKVLKDKGEITLSCWCSPSPCRHAEVIGKAITNLVKKDLLPDTTL